MSYLKIYYLTSGSTLELIVQLVEFSIYKIHYKARHKTAPELTIWAKAKTAIQS